MFRTAFVIALVLTGMIGLPLATAATLGGSQESVESIVKPNFAPISIEDFLRR